MFHCGVGIETVTTTDTITFTTRLYAQDLPVDLMDKFPSKVGDLRRSSYLRYSWNIHCGSSLFYSIREFRLHCDLSSHVYFSPLFIHSNVKVRGRRTINSQLHS